MVVWDFHRRLELLNDFYKSGSVTIFKCTKLFFPFQSITKIYIGLGSILQYIFIVLHAFIQGRQPARITSDPDATNSLVHGCDRKREWNKLIMAKLGDLKMVRLSRFHLSARCTLTAPFASRFLSPIKWKQQYAAVELPIKSRSGSKAYLTIFFFFFSAAKSVGFRQNLRAIFDVWTTTDPNTIQLPSLGNNHWVYAETAFFIWL